MSKNISRRDFIKGAAAGAMGVAALGIVGACSSTTAPAAEPTQTPASTAATTAEATATPAPAAEAPALHSWEVVPEPIPESEITATYQADVIIIGGGYAGVSTAASACEQGLSVILVEKHEMLNGHGVGGTGAVESRALAPYESEGYKIDKPLNMARWIKTCGGRCRESLVAKYFRESGRCMDWLLDIAEADGAVCLITANASNSPVHKEEHSYHWLMQGSCFEEYGMATAVPYMLLKHAYEKGGDNMRVDWNTSAKQLLTEDGKVIGAVCETESDYVKYLANKGVVLATGDISRDDEMLEYFAPIGTKVMTRLCGDPGNTGDGHKMAHWVGGAFQDGPWPTMMHPQAAAGFHGPFLFVNPNGERFMNEGTWVQGKCVGIMVNGKSDHAWSVFDKNWPTDLLNGLPYGGGMFWDSFRLYGSSDQDAVDYFVGAVDQGIADGSPYYLKADTLEELAGLMQVPVDTFMATVERYNGMCEAGEDTDFYKETPFLTPIKEGPFYATMVGTGLLAVVGGVHISDDFQVLTADDQPISGLYAVGNVSGDFYAYDYPINIQGNSHGRCLCWGKLLGEHLATL